MKHVVSLETDLGSIEADSHTDLEQEMNSLFKNRIKFKSNVTQICPVFKFGQNIVIVGFEDGKVCIVHENSKIYYSTAHSSQIRRVSVTSDQNFAVTCSRDGTIKLLNLETGEPHKNFDCGSDVISISVYKNIIFGGSVDGRVHLIDLDTDLKTSILGHRDQIRWVAISPNGLKLFSLSNDKTIKVYDMHLQEIGSLIGHEDWVTRIDFTPDSQLAVTGSNDNTVILWDFSKLRLESRFTGHTDQIWSIACSSNGKWAASGSKDFKVLLWNLIERRLEIKFEGHKHEVTHLKISSDNKFIASASFDKTVKLWSLEGMRLEASFEGHTHFVRCVEFSDDGKTVFSAGSDKSLMKWELFTQSTTHVMKGHSEWIRKIVMVPDSDLLVSCGKDKTVRLWKIDGQLEETFIGHNGDIWALDVTPDGKFAISGSYDKTARIWDLNNRTFVSTLEGHEEKINSLMVTSNGKNVVTISEDNTIRVWDLETRSIIHIMKGHQESVIRLALSPDAKHAYSSSRDKSIKMWDLTAGSLVHTLDIKEDISLALTVSKSNSIVVSGCNDKSLTFYDSNAKKTLRLIENAHGGDINKIIITPDDLSAISASDDKSLKIWNMNNFSLKSVLEGHAGIVTNFEITTDGKYLASVSRDKTVKVWNLNLNKLELSFENHTDVLYAVAIAPDNERVISGSFDNTIGVHYMYCCSNVQKEFAGVFNSNIDDIQKIINYKTNPFSKDLKFSLVFPLHINVLHLYAYSNKPEDMKKALEAGTSYFTSLKYGSPLSLAILRNNFEVINSIIEYFVNISTATRVKLDVFYTLKDDLPKLFKLRLRTIADLLTSLAVMSNEIELKKYIDIEKELPVIKFSESFQFNTSLFEFDTKNKTFVQINYFAIPLRLNLEIGSESSLKILDDLELCLNSNVFVSRFVKAIIDLKWQKLRYFFYIEFFNYATYLGLMCVYLSRFGNNTSGYALILIFNSIFLFLEVLQIIANVKAYMRSFWNILDILRIFYCYGLIIFLLIHDSSSEEIVFSKIFLMILCWLKGLSYFRLFNKTRYFVTMLSDIIYDSIGFTCIFFYSIVAFANLFQLILNDKDSSYFSMFEETFQTIFGSEDILDMVSESSKAKWLIFLFTTLIVTVIMLNLLISIFSDTYDRVQMLNVQTSNRLKVSMIYEIEKMIFWRRKQGTEKYMVFCDKVEVEGEDWEGKMKVIVQEAEIIGKNLKDNFTNLDYKIQETRKSIEEKLDMILRKNQN